MKKQTLLVASFCLLVGLAAVPAYAQTVAVQARIPFNFVVLGSTFPAGEYILIPGPHLVTIEDSDRRPIARVLANEGSDSFVGSQIVFHCYTDRCFLSELRSSIQGNDRQLLPSRTEAELAKKEHRKYYAVLVEKLRMR